MNLSHKRVKPRTAPFWPEGDKNATIRRTFSRSALGRLFVKTG